MDYSAAKTLLQLRDDLHECGMTVAYVADAGQLIRQLKTYGLGTEANRFNTLESALQALCGEISM